ncbi:MAG: tail fiber domain-containing protein, partial [Bacteroidota bacterium]
QRGSITSPAEGLMIYNLDDSCFNYYVGNRWIKDCGTVNGKAVRPVSLPYTGTGNNITPLDIAVDAQGNQHIMGTFKGTVNIGGTSLTSNGDDDVFVAKIDSEGIVQWVFQIGGTGTDFGGGLSLDMAGNVYACGAFPGSITLGGNTLIGNGPSDLFVAKISPAGQYLWAINANGPSEGAALGIATDANGNSVITGVFLTTITLGNTTLQSTGNTTGVFFARLNSTGQFMWAVNGEGSGQPIPIDVALDQQGNVYGTGFFDPDITFGSTMLTGTQEQVYLTKLSATGLFMWAIEVGGVEEDRPGGVAVDNAGNVYVGGSFGNTATFGSFQRTSNGNDDVFVVKVDPSGQVLWVNSFGGTGLDNGGAIVSNPNGDIYLSGNFTGTVPFGSTNLVSTGSQDIFITKLNTSGQTLWARRAGSPVQDLGTNVTLGTGKVYVTGAADSNAEFDGVSTPTAGGFIWKLNAQDGSKVEEELRLNDLQDGDSDAANELQSLTLTANQLSLSNGGSVSLSTYLDNTDNQTLNLNANQLSLTNGGAVDLSSFYQTLSLNANQLSLTNGGAVALSSFQDNLGNHQATQNLQLGSFYLSGDGGNEGISISSDGNVLIGTNTTLRAKLHINGGALSTIGAYTYLANPPPPIDITGTNSGGNTTFSLYATDRIAAAEFNAHSDLRIKDVEGISDAGEDLHTLMQLEITNYRMKDTIAKGIDPYKKVIAQQVAEVYPQAVTTDLIEVVPDIYQRAERQDGWIILATNLQVGERVKLITEQSAAVYEVSAVEAGRFQVFEPASQNAFLDLADSTTVFVYGREVYDFHTVDYEAISMLNVSATQAQQALLEEQQKEIEQLKRENHLLRQSFEARLQLLEASLEQNRIGASQP